MRQGSNLRPSRCERAALPLRHASIVDEPGIEPGAFGVSCRCATSCATRRSLLCPPWGSNPVVLGLKDRSSPILLEGHWSTDGESNPDVRALQARRAARPPVQVAPTPGVEPGDAAVGTLRAVPPRWAWWSGRRSNPRLRLFRPVLLRLSYRTMEPTPGVEPGPPLYESGARPSCCAGRWPPHHESNVATDLRRVRCRIRCWGEDGAPPGNRTQSVPG